MSLSSILSTTINYLLRLRKKKLIEVIESLREGYKKLLTEKLALEERVKTLEAEVSTLKKTEKIKSINKKSNQPIPIAIGTKQAEWEEKGLSGVGNEGQKKKKGRGKKGRKGAGNVSNKEQAAVTEEEIVEVISCDRCGKDLSEQPTLKSVNTRQIIDIPESVEEVVVTQVYQGKKYCSDCQAVVTGKTELALPSSDIGLNTVIRVIYLWISMSMPYTRIQSYLTTFFSMRISTSGLSSLVIRVANILKSVYEEILEDVKSSKILQADETGWRVNGKSR